MSIISKARTGTGRTVQGLGFILWLVTGILVLIWTLYVLFSTFGIWTIFVGLLFAPITYIASIFIVWFSSGDFPLIMLAPYLGSFVGMIMMGIGGSIAGDS